MSDTAILIVSFGTTHDDTRMKNIGEVEKSMADAFPGEKVYSAYTSGMVRRILKKRGVDTFGVDEALDAIGSGGIRRVLIQPTHLLYGEEYEKILQAVRCRADRFESVRMGKPLLADYSDIDAVLNAVDKEIVRDSDEALVLMGHGTTHYCNTVYAAMDYYAKQTDRHDIFIGTVEAYPDLETVIGQVKKSGYRRAVLLPLMLVAGDHAVNNMAAPGEESWLSRFRAAGIASRAVVKGLGEIAAIRKIYCRHAEEAVRFGV